MCHPSMDHCHVFLVVSFTFLLGTGADYIVEYLNVEMIMGNQFFLFSVITLDGRKLTIGRHDQSQNTDQTWSNPSRLRYVTERGFASLPASSKMEDCAGQRVH
jgi:hypothetical protein